ncbi:MAG: hypothetical protein V1772_02315 [Chloroflexota bacterium]
MADCEDCRAVWSRRLRAAALLVQADHEPAPAGLALRVMQRVRRRAAWLAWARGAALGVLAVTILLAMALMPLAAAMGLALDAPVVFRAWVSLVAQGWGVASALLRAAALVLSSALAGSGWLWILGGATLAAVLTCQWVRLVFGRPRLGAGHVA